MKAGDGGTGCDAAKRDPAHEAWWLMFSLVQTERGSFQAACTEHELSPAQAQLLLSLGSAGGRPMSELASDLACDASNITGLVDKLEERGVLERQPAPHDRRVKLIQLTKLGSALRTHLEEFFATPPAGFAHLSVAEKRSLRDLLRKVTG